MAQFDPKREEKFYIKGDRDAYSDDPMASAYRQGAHLDPDGTGQVGQASELDLTAGGKKITVFYDGKYGRYELIVDVYSTTPGQYEAHLYCPKCHEVSRITSERKGIELEDGKLSIEKWQCTWEISEGRKLEFGLGLCRAAYGLDRNVLKDA